MSTVVLREGRIASLEPGDRPVPGGMEFDGSGLLAAPGFIDLQINGGHGIDIGDDPLMMWELGRVLPRYGVTAFLPTLVSCPPPTVDRGLAALGSRPEGYKGAEPLGLHLEGPMLNPRYRGAHPMERLREPSLGLISGWTRSRGVRLVTLAPELDGADSVIRELTAGGVLVAAGHTGATDQQAREAFEAGVVAVTHLFNAMAFLHHRRPNLVGVALTDPAVVVTLVVDGVHVDPLLVDLVWKAKGPGSVALVTDAMAGLGMTGGSSTLAGQTVGVSAGVVRLSDGTIAGSVLSLVEAIRNLREFTGCTVEEAIRCASATPAALVGLHDRGHTNEGAVADLVLLDQRLEIVATFCRGNLSYLHQDHQRRLIRITDH